MKVYDTVKKEELEVDGTRGLIQLMRDGRQVDLYLNCLLYTSCKVLHGCI